MRYLKSTNIRRFSVLNPDHDKFFRNNAEAPIRKLTVDLIKTYKGINEVRFFLHLFFL